MTTHKNKIHITLTAISVALGFSACVDEVEFGNSFLEKSSGSDVTADTVFSSASYVTQYLNTLYAFQYYGIPYCNTYSQQAAPFQESNDIYVGKTCMLTDCYVTNYGFGLNWSYLQGNLTSNYGNRQDKFHYTHNRVWEAIRYAYNIMERIDEVPDMSEDTKISYKAQAKCIVATRYFDIFRHYGAVPIVDRVFTGAESDFSMTRPSIDVFVDHLCTLLDEACEVLPWTLSNFSGDLGHWTKAGAMALKCKILAFAASPIFTDDQPYYASAYSTPSEWSGSEANPVWYGQGHSDEMWQRCLKACEAFFSELNANGGYHLWTIDDNANPGTRPEDYRLAYRNAYAQLESPEILHTVRHFTTDAYKSGYYVWHQWMSPTLDSDNGGGQVNRGYYPTQEYAEMFAWKDGKNFDWDEAAANEGTSSEYTLQNMFGKMDIVSKAPSYYNLTRDPRMYEEMWVNGMNYYLDWTTANMSGVNQEIWVGGTDALQSQNTQTGRYPSGYGLMKWVMGEDYKRVPTQWITLRLSDLYLTYAEALAQTGNLTKAIEQIDIVRARVGMGGLAEMNPTLGLTANKDELINQLLRERACELGMEDTRWFDLMRYKRTDILTKQLHGLRIYWLKNGQRNEKPWYDGNKLTRGAYPTEFEFEKFEWTASPRIWWTQGFDPKWFMSPIPVAEINKGYGLVQNPGW